MATNAPRINEKKLSDDEYSALCEIKYLRSTLSFLQKRVRRKARVQYPYYLMYDEIIGKLPKYAENSSEFPVHLQFEGIWDDPEDTHDRQTLHPIQYYKKKIRALEEQYISKLDELMDNQGQLANEVKKALRIERAKENSFLKKVDFDDFWLDKLSQKNKTSGYLDDLD
ncbi:uncharacterized protein LOC123268744 [Cotesia glomerata]|uniref:Uncharacterized protein n=1 Tax=Cotesia glomerata TaxID=32391 RepID=A0AAV7I639_COTGL|nr:uncharacterized protein LOC123268744 [Cotesia glomerata]KAH0545657.1 hypothetical protein KQX54_002103 [Cotesia glomerata]